MERYVRLILAVIALIIGFVSTAQAAGFQFPMVPKYCEGSSCGYHYAQYAEYPSGWVYHPGWDMNVWGTSGDDDCGDPIYAVADGTVEIIDLSVWGGLLVSHEYNGETFYSMYGHVQAVHVTDGQIVHKGDHVADIGKVGTSACHLHLEIRTEDHPDIFTSDYWNTTGFRDLNLLNEWYEDPEDFLVNHAISWRDTTALTTTNPYSNASNYLGSQSGDWHWWDGYAVDDPTDTGAVSNGYAKSLYIQDYNGAYCDSTKPYGSGVNDGAIVYDALGGARSAYIVQCEQWDTWISEDAPTIGPESWLGNPVTNVYKAGDYNFYQLFQGGFIRTNADGTVTPKPYTNGFAPGEMADGSWNPQISYRFAEAYELHGAHKKLGMPSSGVEQVSTDYYVQHFPGQKPRSDDDRYLLYGVEQQAIVKISVSQYNALIASQSASVFTNVDDSATDTIDQDSDGYTPNDGDCDDTADHVHPDMTELLDGVDNDCDGYTDESDPDDDLDGDGYTPSQGDCNDTADHVNPGQVELLDGVDNDCDGVIDEDLVEDQYLFFDANGDGDDDPCVRRGTDVLCDTDGDHQHDVTCTMGSNSAVYYGSGDSLIVRYGSSLSYEDDCDGNTNQTFTFTTGSDDQFLFWHSTVVARDDRFFLVDRNRDGVWNTYFYFGEGNTDEYHLADLDGDGYPDFILRRGNRYYVDVTSDGSWDWFVDFGRSTDPLYTGDLNGDGKDDLIVLRGNTLYVLDRISHNSTNNDASYTFTYGRGL